MAEFNREFRYLVLKCKDLNKYLTEKERVSLLCLTSKVSKGRCNDGKNQLHCVVAESDWPEYEPTWQAIERRMTGVVVDDDDLHADTAA